MGRFFGEFVDADQVLSEFEVSDFAGQILAAVYDQESYEGSATVIFVAKDGKLYEVNGSHCSCFGLEGQWEPELVEPNELRQRMLRRGDDFADEVLTLLPPAAEA